MEEQKEGGYKMEEDKIIIETKEGPKEFYKLATFYSNKRDKRI